MERGVVAAGGEGTDGGGEGAASSTGERGVEICVRIAPARPAAPEPAAMLPMSPADRLAVGTMTGAGLSAPPPLLGIMIAADVLATASPECGAHATGGGGAEYATTHNVLCVAVAGEAVAGEIGAGGCSERVTRLGAAPPLCTRTKTCCPLCVRAGKRTRWARMLPPCAREFLTDSWASEAATPAGSCTDADGAWLAARLRSGAAEPVNDDAVVACATAKSSLVALALESPTSTNESSSSPTASRRPKPACDIVSDGRSDRARRLSTAGVRCVRRESGECRQQRQMTRCEYEWATEGPRGEQQRRGDAPLFWIPFAAHSHVDVVALLSLRVLP